MKNTLVISAHPDDEILGCTGLICKLRTMGYNIYVLYLSEGVTSRYKDHLLTDKINKEINLRKSMAMNASKILNFEIIDFFDLPNLRMENLEILDIVKKITKVVKKVKPSIILSHHPGDLNTDHKVAFKASFTALRPFTYSFKIKQFMTFEIPSSTNWSHPYIGSIFKPNYYLNIKNYLKIKKRAFDCYKHEMRDFPHPRSWKSIMSGHISRGGEVGYEYAEAYSIVRLID